MTLTATASEGSVLRRAQISSGPILVKTFSAALLIAACLIAPAKAQTVDLSNLRCKEFVDSGKDMIAVVVMWLDGYFTDEEDPAVIDLEKIKARSERLVSRCAQNPAMKLLTAA